MALLIQRIDLETTPFHSPIHRSIDPDPIKYQYITKCTVSDVGLHQIRDCSWRIMKNNIVQRLYNIKFGRITVV